MNLNQEICKTFNKYALTYDKAAKVQYEIGARLFERLNYLKIAPRYILDLGCGPGFFTRQLKKKYPKAIIIAVDIAYQMLMQIKKKQRFWSKSHLINADMHALPFTAGQFDLIFANQVIHWAKNPSSMMAELNRIMNVDGCLMFSTLGPDTFKELKAAWQQADVFAHANNFLDMHDVGDSLMQANFVDPVVDMEMLTAHYSSLMDLTKSLKAQGVRNINPKRNPGLTGKKTWEVFTVAYQSYCTLPNKFPLSYEIIYGHAWKGNIKDNNDIYIPISQINLLKR